MFDGEPQPSQRTQQFVFSFPLLHAHTRCKQTFQSESSYPPPTQEFVQYAYYDSIFALHTLLYEAWEAVLAEVEYALGVYILKELN